MDQIRLHPYCLPDLPELRPGWKKSAKLLYSSVSHPPAIQPDSKNTSNITDIFQNKYSNHIYLCASMLTLSPPLVLVPLWQLGDVALRFLLMVLLLWPSY